jgi:WD40 repeat protein
VPGFALLRCIGRGSYGEVWLARDGAGEYRAVKVVYRKTFEHDRPFERELSGIRKFEPVSRSHPSQVSILQVGRNDAEGYFYYVMELADDAGGAEEKGRKGERENSPPAPSLPFSPANYLPRTLKSDLARRGRLSFHECLDIGIALATALEHLHQHGLIHRDIKPSNVIFVRGVPKLADIGLVTDADATISFVGTEGFLPPEGPGTPTADIYSLGKVLYELSTGRDRMDFPELPTFVDEAADNERLLELNAVVLKACQNDPRRRYQSAREILADLTLLQSGRSLRRAHALEQRLVTARRLGATVIFVILAAALGNHFMQQQRLRRAQKEKALQELRASWAQGVATDKSHQLADVYAANGATLEAEGDYFGALLSFARALGDEQDDPARAAAMEALWPKCPALPALLAHRGGVNSATFSADGRRIITAGDDRVAQVWNASSGEPMGEPLRHSNRVVHAELSADGEQALTVSADGVCQLWTHLGNGAAPATRLEQAGSVARAKFSPAGRQFVTVGDGPDVLLWELSSQRPRFTLKHAGRVTDAVFSPDGRFLAGASSDHVIQVWPTATGDLLAPAIRHEEAVRCLSFSPDSRRLVSASGSKARVWLARSGEPASFTLRHDAAILSVGFSPDGKQLLTAGDDQTARVWDAVNGQAIGVPLRHREAVHAAAFSPDGRFIATVSGKRVALWEARSLRLIPPAWIHNDSVHDLRFSPAGHELLTASADGTARLIGLEIRGSAFGVPRSEFTPPGTTKPERGTPHFDAQTWMSWAQMLSGRQVSSNQQIAALPADALRKLWQSLKLGFPREFEPPDLLNWHRHAAEISEQSADWFSACFHWKRALTLAPGDDRFRAARERAEHELERLEVATGRDPELRIPARPPTTRSQLIDLSEHYNAALTETWLPTGGMATGHDLSALPRGMQKFGGVEFDVRGIVQLSGGAVENAGGKFPRRINAIHVGQACRRIHFLHGAAWSALAGTPVGSYVFHYASGESREVKIIFGQNVPQLTTGAAVAWEGANAASRALGLSVRLYQMTWKNPLPDAEVREIDFKSMMENPAPFLIAVTIE